jgi:PAS domain S-box-containing protein
LKAARGLRGSDRYLLSPGSSAGEWIATLGTASAIAIIYFLAARLGLALLTQPEDVAVFWPASGIAAGILITLGRRVRVAVVIGVVVATIAANLMGDRSFWTSIFKGFCNASEAVLTAWLIERWFGRAFAFDNLRRVLGFLVAACLGAAASAVPGAATMDLFQTTAPYWDVWRAWILSDGVGIVVVAPLIIGLGQVWRNLPTRGEWIEGVGGLALMSLASLYVVTHPTSSWITFSPGALVLPLLLWLTARCQPTFGIAGAFVASFMVIWAITFGIGRFGDGSVPIMERVKGAQLAMTMVTIYTLVLTALFAQRKEAEKELRESEGRLARERAMLTLLQETGSRLWLNRDLRQALSEILAGAIELLAADMGTIRILDTQRSVLKIEAHRGFKQKALDFFDEVPVAGDSLCGRALRAGERIVVADVEADPLFTTFRPLARAAGYRAMQSTPITNRDGMPLGMLETHFYHPHKPTEQDLRLLDLYVRQAAEIIERHRAEDALRESEERLRLAQLRTGVGIFDRNLRTGRVMWTPELEALFGLEPGAVNCYSDFRKRAHPDDIEAFEAQRDAAVRKKRPFSVEFRIIRTDGEIRWMSVKGGAVYDDVTGEPVRILGNFADITERKAAEERLQKNEQLFRELLGALPAAIYVTDAAGRITYCNEGAVNLWGVRPKLAEDKWCDLARFYYPDGKRMEIRDCPTEIALKEGKCVRGSEAILERMDGTRIPMIPYPTALRDATGAIVGVVNMMVDISERQKAERALAELNAQLALAAKAALVSSHAYDADLERMTVSEGYAAIHGLPEGTTESTRREWRARVHPQDLPRLEENRAQCFRDKRDVYNVDYRIIRASGEVRWIEARGIISYDSNGQPRRIIGINIDVTDRKQTEALLKESEARLSDALAAGRVVAFEWDSATGRSQRSDNAERILGMVDGGRFLRQVHADDRSNFKTLIRGLAPGNPSYALTFRFGRADNQQIWLQETAKAEFDSTGSLLRIKGLTRDITLRKQAEQALAERDAQLALAGRAALVGNYVYDVDKGTMQISQGYATIHGLPEGTTETTISEWRSRVHPEDLARAEGIREQAFADRRKEDNAEYRIVLSTGDVRWIERRGAISYGEEGRPEHVIGVNIDVTERKRAEQHQRALNAELDHRVKNVLATVGAIISQTQEASSSRADFVTGLNSRINSLARTHELLSESNWRGASLAEIVRREIAPYTRGNIEVGGPSVTLKAPATQAVATVLHELTTNAAKYGALSSRNGQVSVQWRWLQNGSHDRLVIDWQEIGGPPVLAPSRSGYGTTIIRELIPFELDGAVELSFATEGTRCRLEIPGEWASKDRRTAEENRVSE